MKTMRNLPAIVASRLLKTKSVVGLSMADTEILAIGAPADIYPGYTTTRNTLMKVRIGDMITHIAYNRLDATAYFTQWLTSPGRGMVITTPGPVLTTMDVFKDLCAYVAQDFEGHEWVDEPLVINPNNTITFTASPTNMWLTGSVNIPLQYPTAIVNGTPITQVKPNIVDFNQYNILNGVVGGAELGLLTYDKDYSEFTNDLIVMDTTALLDQYVYSGYLPAAQAQQLAQILTTVDGYPWVYDTTAPSLMNLAYCIVLYNGPSDNFYTMYNMNRDSNNRHFDGPGLMTRDFQRARPEKQFVMVVMMNAASGTNKQTNYCLHFIHYGDDVEDSHINQEDRRPLHHWPLSTDRNNYGVSDMPFGPCGTVGNRPGMGWDKFTLNAQGYNTYPPAGVHYLGPQLPVNKDFTFSFTAWIIGAASGSAANGLVFYKDGQPIAKRGHIANTAAMGWDMLGTWPISKRHPTNSMRQVNMRCTVTVVRKGLWQYLYIDGLFSQVTYGEAEIDYIDAVANNQTNQAVSINNIYYFDYALNSRQVRRMLAGDFDKIEEVVYVEAPEPLHYWPLDGKLDDLGTANKPLNGAFDWKQVELDTWATRPSGGGGQSLGVSLPIDVDFTFQFDYYTVNDANVGTLLSGGDTETDQNGNLKVRYGIPMVSGADPLTHNTIHRITANTKHTWTIVCKDGCFYSYIDGELDRSFRRSARNQSNVTDAWTHFGRGPEYMNVGERTRNWKYWDIALTPEQVVVESYRGKK